MLVVSDLGGIPRLIGIVALLTGVMLRVSERKVRRPNATVILAAVFVLWSSASVLWSIDTARSLQRVVTLVQLFGMLWLITDQANTAARRNALFQAFVLGAGVAGATTVGNFLAGRSLYVYEERYGAGLFDPNELGLTLSMAIPLAWMLALRGGSIATVQFNRFVIPILAFAALLTASRSALVSLVVALFAIILTATSLRVGQQLVLAIVAPVAAYSAWVMIPMGVMVRLSTVGAEMSGLNNRADLWRVGYQVFVNSPFAGVGVGAFPTATQSTRLDAEVAHNTFVTVAVESGMIGLALFGLLFLTTLSIALHFTGVERRVWLIVILTWVIGASTLSWDYKKPTWLLFGFIAAHAMARSSAANFPRIAFDQSRSGAPSFQSGSGTRP
jgi:O-antigen ligase